MRSSIIAGVAALVLPVCLQAVEHTDTWQRTFPLTGERRLVVRNINGDVRVKADSGNDVRITVRELYEAETAESLAELRNEIKLVARQEGGTVRVAIEHPEGDRDRRGKGRRDWRFHHDIEIHAPRDAELQLQTINGKELSVTGAAGHWELKNINGALRLRDVTGYGSVETINGPVDVSFAANPKQPSSFKTINGTIDVRFQPDLAADLTIGTLHGEAYTDFDYQPAASSPNVERDGRRHRISRHKARLRVGAGGIEHQFNSLNGSIRIRKHGRQG